MFTSLGPPLLLLYKESNFLRKRLEFLSLVAQESALSLSLIHFHFSKWSDNSQHFNNTVIGMLAISTFKDSRISKYKFHRRRRIFHTMKCPRKFNNKQPVVHRLLRISVSEQFAIWGQQRKVVDWSHLPVSFKWLIICIFSAFMLHLYAIVLDDILQFEHCSFAQAVHVIIAFYSIRYPIKAVLIDIKQCRNMQEQSLFFFPACVSSCSSR